MRTSAETSDNEEQNNNGRRPHGASSTGAASETRAAVVETIGAAMKTSAVGLILIELLIDEEASGSVDVTRELQGRIERCMLGHDTMLPAGIHRIAVVKQRMTGPAETEGFALRLLNAIGGPIMSDDGQAGCHSAIGVAVSHADDSPEDLLRYAEHALGDARMLGGEMVVFFEDADRELLPEADS